MTPTIEQRLKGLEERVDIFTNEVIALKEYLVNERDKNAQTAAKDAKAKAYEVWKQSLKVNDPILVRSEVWPEDKPANPKRYVTRCFLKFSENGNFLTFEDGKNSWTHSCSNEAEEWIECKPHPDYEYGESKDELPWIEYDGGGDPFTESDTEKTVLVQLKNGTFNVKCSSYFNWITHENESDELQAFDIARYIALPETAHEQ